MVLRRFEDLVPWQRARELTRIIYVLTSREPFAYEPLAMTMRKAIVLVTSNIAAGFETRGTKHSQQRLRIALTTSSGLRLHVSIAYERGYLNPTEYDELMRRLLELRYMIDNLQSTLGYH
jgi:four helix bundle protein